ncbi:LutC/YkgG family protein [Azospira restricta]|uniref:Lactate utilization protein n=1 Tax=Azospira restricta TaxID=404405 RepID=A0A974PWH7_9RHOO|nr:lactate utilization protein [Azospira restricta]QRJ62729.1 lactate utilization protein [Azospira restricta]
MSARDNILAKLRAGATHTTAPAPLNPDAAIAEHYASLPRTPKEQLAQEFAEKITAWHAEVHRVPRGQWVDKLKEVVAAKGIRNLLYAPATTHGRALEAAGIQGLKPYDRPIDEWKQALFENVDAAITGTRGAIAETGTMIVWPDASEPRTMSLVPPIHIALVDEDSVVPTLYDAIVQQKWTDGLPTNALLVTGPSKTADIQQTLAYGAHGPKELVVLLLTGEAL